MKKIFTFLFFIIYGFQLSFSQIGTHGQCGYEMPAEQVNRLLDNKAWIQQYGIPEGNTNYLPIKFHIVGTDNGGGYISESRVFEGLCKLNEDYADTDLQFYFYDEFNYINNSAMYDLTFPGVPSSVNQLYVTHRHPNAIDIFIGNGLSSGNSGYYTGQFDVIYMDKAFVNGSDNILAHEMGHYFSLAHPFYGWENTTYNPNQPTPTTVFYTGNNWNVEYVDRTINCDNSGDFLCGTPADYILDWGGGCNYTGGAVDPDSVAIDPDEGNFMGYYSFSGCMEYFFSDDQIDVIRADYFNRTELTSIVPPSLVSVTDSAEIISPVNDEVVEFYNEVNFEWEPVADATHYLIEISRLSSFAYSDESAVVSSTEYTATNLFKNKDYLWRVWAFNQMDVCVEKNYSASGTFRTGTLDVSSNHDLDKSSLDITISPNPITERNNSVNVLLGKMIQDVHLQIFDLKGQLILEKNIDQINKGWNTILTENEVNLTAGIYILHFKNQEILQSKKLIVH